MIGWVEGLDLSAFNAVRPHDGAGFLCRCAYDVRLSLKHITACYIFDYRVLATVSYPMWLYETLPLSAPFELLRWDFMSMRLDQAEQSGLLRGQTAITQAGTLQFAAFVSHITPTLTSPRACCLVACACAERGGR